MFESGNIQSRPVPELYQKSSLQTRTWNVPATLAASLESAEYSQVVVNGQKPSTELAILSTGLESVIYFAPILSGSDQLESVSVGAGLESAVYLSPLLLGDEQNEAVSIEASLFEADYELVVFDSTAAPNEPLTISASLESITYETP